MNQPGKRHTLRGAAIARKSKQKPSLIDRLGIWLSSGKTVDGLWLGTEIGEGQPSLSRVEDALRLIKQHNSLHYSRVVQHLKRVWVRLIPHGDGCYYASLEACALDPRFVLQQTTTLDAIASAIVHEATHARLDRWGVSYNEDKRNRIEAICRRRELNFLAGVPNTEPLREQVAHALEWCACNPDFYSDASFQQRIHEGNVETLHYLGTPEWLIRLLLKGLAIGRSLRRFLGRPQQA
jgi:hypothetical protein